LAGAQHSTSSAGLACRRAATPAAPTWVWLTLRARKLGRASTWARPASVTRVRYRASNRRLVRSRRCARLASVTAMAPRFSVSNPWRPDRNTKPASVSFGQAPRLRHCSCPNAATADRSATRSSAASPPLRNDLVHGGDGSDRYRKPLVEQVGPLLDDELARMPWLARCPLLRPVTIANGTVRTADLLNGTDPLPDAAALGLDRGALNPQCPPAGPARDSRLLAAHDRRAYVPLFPLGCSGWRRRTPTFSRGRAGTPTPGRRCGTKA